LIANIDPMLLTCSSLYILSTYTSIQIFYDSYSIESIPDHIYQIIMLILYFYAPIIFFIISEYVISLINQ
jgi:hypothetical protein